MATKLQSSTIWKILKLFTSYWMRFPRLFFGSVLFAPAYAIQYVITPLFIALGLQELIKTGEVPVQLIVIAATTLAVGLVTGFIVNYHFDAELERRVEMDLINDCFNYLEHQDYDFFTNNFSGSLVTKANRLLKAYTIFHVTFFIDLLPQLIGVLIVLAIIIHYSLVIGTLLALFWLISLGIICMLVLKRMPLRRLAVQKDSQLTGELADVITNSITVKTFAGEAREAIRYGRTNKERGDLLLKSWKVAIRNGWVVESICAAIQLMVFILGIVAVHKQQLSLPIFLLFQVYVIRIIDHLRKSVFTMRQFEGVFGDAQEMTQLLEEPSTIQDPESPEKAHFSKGVVGFKNITFRYTDNAAVKTNLFENFSLDIKKGEKVGLVGPSGGGKTTITKLLLRFLDIQQGEITIDEQNITAVRQVDLRLAIAYVPQEPLLFHRSIKENISYGKADATDAEIIAVAKKAFAHDFIKKLPNGYDTLVGERGVKLSGGQRQRVAIARAMLKNALILVLDEATSALDSESEKVIQAALWELMEDRTAIVIAHRLSTIQKLDRIIVIDEGKIIEEGSHQQLLDKKGLYARLWKHQSGGFLQE